jgi:hypothetical protein
VYVELVLHVRKDVSKKDNLFFCLLDVPVPVRLVHELVILNEVKDLYQAIMILRFAQNDSSDSHPETK